MANRLQADVLVDELRICLRKMRETMENGDIREDCNHKDGVHADPGPPAVNSDRQQNPQGKELGHAHRNSSWWAADMLPQLRKFTKDVEQTNLDDMSAGEKQAVGASLEHVLMAAAHSSRAAQKILLALQAPAQTTSRAGYLKSLSDIIGPEPTYTSATEEAARWRREWRKMYMELQHNRAGEGAELPEPDWAALEAQKAATFKTSIEQRVANDWDREMATIYTWLSSQEAREPMAWALRDENSRYAGATYALYRAMATRVSHTTALHHRAYRNLHGVGSLVSSDERWRLLESPDANGFCGLTTFALTRPVFASARTMCEGGFKAQVSCGEGSEHVLQDSDVVAFDAGPPDEHGFHAGLNVSATSVAFPPNTLFRLKEVKERGTWEAAGVFPLQRLLVVTPTFRMPRARGDEEGHSKVCTPPTTLSYGNRAVFVRGLRDVLEKPLLSMAAEWTRDSTWVDRQGRLCSLRKEWEYVTKPVPSVRPAAGGEGERDAGNVGKTPHEFAEEVNAHIAARRSEHAACRRLPETHAFLSLDEVLAVRLYSGPGFQPINEFLRELGKLSGKFRSALARHPDFTFTATAAHLSRAVRKLAAVTAPSQLERPLFRAVRGELPRAFWVPDEQGMVCAIDAGFMSTSKNATTPLHYLGAGSANVLWRMQTCAESDAGFHHGADISLLSQFPAEEEVLFPPCSMLLVLPSKDESGRKAEAAEVLGGLLQAWAALPETASVCGREVEFMAVDVRPCFV